MEVDDFGKQKSGALKMQKCNQCEYSSKNSSHLRTHIKMHSGEKSYKCYQCDYATAYATDLRKHMKNKLGNNQTNATFAIMHLCKQVI